MTLDKTVIMKHYSMVTHYLEEGGKQFAQQHPVEIWAMNEIEAKLLIALHGYVYIDLWVEIEQIDAGDLGGLLGELCNRFDPTLN